MSGVNLQLWTRLPRKIKAVISAAYERHLAACARYDSEPDTFSHFVGEWLDVRRLESGEARPAVTREQAIREQRDYRSLYRGPKQSRRRLKRERAADENRRSEFIESADTEEQDHYDGIN